MSRSQHFHFGPANPVSGKRGLDHTVRMHIVVAWAQALRECLIEDRRWNPIGDEPTATPPGSEATGRRL